MLPNQTKQKGIQTNQSAGFTSAVSQFAFRSWTSRDFLITGGVGQSAPKKSFWNIPAPVDKVLMSLRSLRLACSSS